MKHLLQTEFYARLVRFHPKEWNERVAMRAEVYGCRNGTFGVINGKSLLTFYHDVDILCRGSKQVVGATCVGPMLVI